MRLTRPHALKAGTALCLALASSLASPVTAATAAAAGASKPAVAKVAAKPAPAPKPAPKPAGLTSLIVETPEDGFALAIKLSQKAVGATQKDVEVRR